MLSPPNPLPRAVEQPTCCRNTERKPWLTRDISFWKPSCHADVMGGIFLPTCQEGEQLLVPDTHPLGRHLQEEAWHEAPPLPATSCQSPEAQCTDIWSAQGTWGLTARKVPQGWRDIFVSGQRQRRSAHSCLRMLVGTPRTLSPGLCMESSLGRAGNLHVQPGSLQLFCIPLYLTRTLHSCLNATSPTSLDLLLADRHSLQALFKEHKIYLMRCLT